MKCENCNNLLPENANFCNKCGAPVSYKKPSNEIIKIKKKLKNAGDSVYAIGWLIVIAKIGIYFWSIFDRDSFISIGFPLQDLTGTFLVVVVGSVFIILGDRIRRAVDKAIVLYLKILLIISLIVVIFTLISSGRIGILFFLIIIYLISALISMRKAMNIKEFTESLIQPKYNFNKKNWIIGIAIFFIVIFIDMYLYNRGFYDYTPQKEKEINSQNLFIEEMVKEMKTNIDLPYQINKNIKLIDITSELNAIRYHYILSNIDTSNLSNSSMKEYLNSYICSDSYIKSLFDLEVGIEHLYIVEKPRKEYLISFTKNDCLE